ncbi:MAG: hypothetical protein Q8Q58_03180, partial [Candidatus Rokubacteria bacterium]|nr:hypothetical protein [Candidatus Rokubacteria bacterium]
AYVRTKEGFEVDFLATAPDSPPLILPVCLAVHDSSTWEREVRALAAAAAEHPKTVPLLVTLDSMPPRPPLPKPLRWLPAAAWFLGAPLTETPT